MRLNETVECTKVHKKLSDVNYQLYTKMGGAK